MKTSPESRLLELYDRVADTPGAFDRLRKFVLNLAVRGNLVEQDPDDEPASELLKRIAAEKGRLLEAGEIRKPKKLPPIDSEPFTLPESWRWVCIREITSDRGQKVPDGEFTYLDVTAINKEAGVVAEPKVLSKDEAPNRARKITAKGDVIYSCVRPYLLNVAVLDKDFDPEPIASTAFAVLNGHGLVLPWYLWITLRSPFMVECVEENQRGQAYPAINDKDFSLLPFPLPPLAEQQRIVAKADELMALLDHLETVRTKRETTRNRLTTASLACLTAPNTTPENFPNYARFALDALPALTTRPDQIKALRQTILDLAVRGKLVEQDPTDEPASELLKRVQAEKTRRIEAGEIRKQKPPPPIFPDECSFPEPNGWVWIRLIEIGVTQTGTSPSSSKPELFGDFIPFVKPADLDSASINCNSPGLSREGMKHSRVAPANSVMMVCIGATLGKVNVTDSDVCFNQQINSITPYLNGLHDFLALALKSSEFQESAWARAGIGTLPIISKGKWQVLPIPLPPLAEQHRIVTKVDALMALCDRLEAALTTANTTLACLVETLLNEALAPTTDCELAAVV